MDIKLIKLALISSVLLSACSSSSKNQSGNFYVKEEDYIKSYKISFVCGCINGGTSENFTKFIKDNNDLGLFTEVEVISHQKVKEADSIGRKFSLQIKALSYEDAGNKKPIISRCIYYVLRKEVDSLAKASYRNIK